MRLAALLLALLIPALIWAGGAGAHFEQGSKPRTIIVADGKDGLTALLRVPLPLLFSDVVAEAMQRRAPFAHPLVVAERVSSGVRHRLDLGAIEADPGGWARRLAAAHEWRSGGHEVPVEVLSWRIVGRDPGKGFGTGGDARASMALDGARLDPVFGDAVVEVALALDAPVAAAELEVRSGMPPLPLPPGVTIDNHLRDERGRPVSLTREGQLEGWAILPGSPWGAALAFAREGVAHILEGPDHVLLVVCLALGAGASGRLIALVSAFTLGHVVTLATAALGRVPQPGWFVPAVEAAIAATVVYAAVAAWRGRVEAVWIMSAVGLLHGLGFSFFLAEILGRDAPSVVAALAAFTVGIELGQMAIIAVVLALAWAVVRLSRDAADLARTAALGAIAVTASYWTVTRLAGLA